MNCDLLKFQRPSFDRRGLCCQNHAMAEGPRVSKFSQDDRPALDFEGHQLGSRHTVLLRQPHRKRPK